jgi:hypothetical protein
MYIHIYMQSKTQQFVRWYHYVMNVTYRNPTRYDVRRDLVPPPLSPIVQSTYWFYEQPDGDQLTRPKHVVVYCVVIIIIIINIQHAPLHGNTTRFTVKYSHYGYIYLQFMYNLLFSINTVSLISVFLCIVYCFLFFCLLNY